MLTTSDKGSARVELKSAARLTAIENTSVRFLRDGEEVRAELLSGGVLLESTGKPAIVVTTAKYRFQASREGDCRHFVRLSKERDMIAAAVKGNLSITSNDSSRSYLLEEGKYATIPASASGVPSADEPQGSRSEATPGQQTKRRRRREAVPMPWHEGSPWHIGSLSHGASLAVVAVLSGAAEAAVAVPLAITSGPSGPVSPTAPER